MTWARLLYFAYVLDLATTCCLRDHQGIMFGPKNIAAAKVDFRSSIFEAQSTSQRPLIVKG